jgi:uncharacterized membrane protein
MEIFAKLQILSVINYVQLIMVNFILVMFKYIFKHVKKGPTEILNKLHSTCCGNEVYERWTT